MMRLALLSIALATAAWAQASATARASASIVSDVGGMELDGGIIGRAHNHPDAGFPFWSYE